jgi:large subunit ribosomal protein L3
LRVPLERRGRSVDPAPLKPSFDERALTAASGRLVRGQYDFLPAGDGRRFQPGPIAARAVNEDVSMTIGLIGRKCGMTRVFTDAGESVPVTVIEALPNRVTQVKASESDGYRAVQVAVGHRKPSRIGRPLAGHYAKAKVEPGSALVEFRLADGEGAELAPGAELKVDLFTAGQIVDVTGTTIGKGFAGTMKRHNFAGGMASHGASVVHRAPGSIGQRQTPGRVFPGKRMSGHMGAVRRTTENLRIVEVDAARNLLLIRGAVPGAAGGQVIVRPSVKAGRRAARPKQPSATSAKAAGKK